MSFDLEFCVKKYYGRILSSRMGILVNQLYYGGQNELVGKMYEFL